MTMNDSVANDFEEVGSLQSTVGNKQFEIIKRLFTMNMRV